VTLKHLRWRARIVPSRQSGQIVGLDLVGRILNTNAVYVQVWFLVWWRQLAAVYRWRHDRMCRVRFVERFAKALNDDVG